MDNSNQNISQEGFGISRVSYLLDSAALAEQGGNSRLAIHLYCAAFEASQESDSGVDERALDGLRQAWILACEQGDRPTAETIFNDLAPYNSDEQTRAALSELQDMATRQLGLSREEMEDMALAFVEEIRDAGIDVKALAKQFGSSRNPLFEPLQFDNLGASLGDAQEQSARASQAPGETLEIPGLSGTDGERKSVEILPELRYVDLVGFERVKDRMRAFGIVDPHDVEMNDFLQQAESFHGFSGPVLTQNFLFMGESREDSGIFAQATANEIGWPTITMIVDVNELGDGTIRVIAPVKRSFFGPPRLNDLPNPCILIIQNIDILQDLFWKEEQTINSGQGPQCPLKSEGHHKSSGLSKGAGKHNCHQHTLQNEVLSYLGMLVARGGVFVMATSLASTAERPVVLGEQFENVLGKPAEILVDTPNTTERQQVLAAFSDEHPSFHDLDMASLACLSEGMSRYELILSCRQAVEAAYSESLKHQRHQMVNLEDVLTQFIHYLAQDSVTYRLVEDYLVALFAANLETDLFQSNIMPNQISLDWDELDMSGENYQAN